MVRMYRLVLGRSNGVRLLALIACAAGFAASALILQAQTQVHDCLLYTSLGGCAMSKGTYPLKLPLSIKMAAQRLAKEDGVSLNQWIAVAVAEKVGTVETAANLDVYKRQISACSTAMLLASSVRPSRRSPAI